MSTMKGWAFRWVWISFGLPPNYRIALYEEIFNLCYYSNGGFSHSEVYHMPVHMRRFFIRKLTSTKQEEAAQHEAASKGGSKGGPPKVDRPQFAPRK